MIDFINILDELNKSYYIEQQQRRQERPPRKEHIEETTEGRRTLEQRSETTDGQRPLETTDIDKQIRELEDRILENDIFIKRTQHENEAIEHVKYLTSGRLSENASDELLTIIEENSEYIHAVIRNQRRLRKELKTLREQSNIC